MSIGNPFSDCVAEMKGMDTDNVRHFESIESTLFSDSHCHLEANRGAQRRYVAIFLGWRFQFHTSPTVFSFQTQGSISVCDIVVIVKTTRLPQPLANKLDDYKLDSPTRG